MQKSYNFGWNFLKKNLKIYYDSYDGTTYREVPAQSKFSHQYSRMSSYKGTPFTVGGYMQKSVEELKYGLWNELAEYPYAYS